MLTVFWAASRKYSADVFGSVDFDPFHASCFVMITFALSSASRSASLQSLPGGPRIVGTEFSTNTSLLIKIFYKAIHPVVT